MRARPLSPTDLGRVAARFGVLAEPARLQVLQCLRSGPQHVSALMAATGLRQANLSKHLRTLHAHGLVGRSRTGRFVHYSVADRDVLALCDLMCRQVVDLPADQRVQTVSRTAPARGRGSRTPTRPARATR